MLASEEEKDTYIIISSHTKKYEKVAKKLLFMTKIWWFISSYNR